MYKSFRDDNWYDCWIKALNDERYDLLCIRLCLRVRFSLPLLLDSRY